MNSKLIAYVGVIAAVSVTLGAFALGNQSETRQPRNVAEGSVQCQAPTCVEYLTPNIPGTISALLRGAVVKNGPDGIFLAPAGADPATLSIPIGMGSAGDHITASVFGRATQVGVREIRGCGSFRHVYGGGFVRLQLVSADTDKVIVSQETRKTRWTRIAIAATARSNEMPYRLEVVAGSPVSQNVTYRSYRGATCVTATVAIAPPGIFRPPHYDLGGLFIPTGALRGAHVGEGLSE
jgi:hypothetical protein